MDDDGFFWLTGRAKELTKYKGNQVPPAEIGPSLFRIHKSSMLAFAEHMTPSRRQRFL